MASRANFCRINFLFFIFVDPISIFLRLHFCLFLLNTYVYDTLYTLQYLCLWYTLHLTSISIFSISISGFWKNTISYGKSVFFYFRN